LLNLHHVVRRPLKQCTPGNPEAEAPERKKKIVFGQVVQVNRS